jgi:hypothetical protein
MSEKDSADSEPTPPPGGAALPDSLAVAPTLSAWKQTGRETDAPVEESECQENRAAEDETDGCGAEEGRGSAPSRWGDEEEGLRHSSSFAFGNSPSEGNLASVEVKMTDRPSVTVQPERDSDGRQTTRAVPSVETKATQFELLVEEEELCDSLAITEQHVGLRCCIERAANLRLSSAQASSGLAEVFVVCEWPVTRDTVATGAASVSPSTAGAEWFHMRQLPIWRHRPPTSPSGFRDNVTVVFRVNVPSQEAAARGCVFERYRALTCFRCATHGKPEICVLYHLTGVYPD